MLEQGRTVVRRGSCRNFSAHGYGKGFASGFVGAQGTDLVINSSATADVRVEGVNLLGKLYYLFLRLPGSVDMRASIAGSTAHRQAGVVRSYIGRRGDDLIVNSTSEGTICESGRAGGGGWGWVLRWSTKTCTHPDPI